MEQEFRFRFKPTSNLQELLLSGPDLSTHRAKNLALMLLALTQFVVVIDASITNVALPSIGKALDISQDSLSWVVNSYTLVFGGFLLLGGRLADFLGRRRMFMIGMSLFGLASLAGGLAQSEAWLIIARACQGLGAAIASPAALSIVTTTFAEGSERNRALGIWGAVAGAGGAAHLPGMAAAKTCLPVLGVPVQSKALNGMDSLLSIVQMPAGIPVGTLAIGRAGAVNAALLAASLLGNKYPAIRTAARNYRQAQTAQVLAHPVPGEPT